MHEKRRLREVSARLRIRCLRYQLISSLPPAYSGTCLPSSVRNMPALHVHKFTALCSARGEVVVDIHRTLLITSLPTKSKAPRGPTAAAIRSTGVGLVRKPRCDPRSVGSSVRFPPLRSPTRLFCRPSQPPPQHVPCHRTHLQRAPSKKTHATPRCFTGRLAPAGIGDRWGEVLSGSRSHVPRSCLDISALPAPPSWRKKMAQCV